MEEIAKKLKDVRNNAHCANCGLINPEMVEDGDMPEAYTVCCNEKVCDRLVEHTFGNKKVTVKACCWAVAELEFKARGIDVARQHGMYRITED